MISTRRILAAACLAAGVSGFGAPLAHAADVQGRDAGRVSPVTLLDSLAEARVPVEQRQELPRVSEQLAGLNHVRDVNQLHQLTDLAAPATGLLPGIQ
jgi:hypothetical protein